MKVMNGGKRKRKRKKRENGNMEGNSKRKETGKKTKIK